MIDVKKMGDWYFHLDEEKGSQVVENTADFWSSKVAALPPGRLVCVRETREDWPNWEVHPDGDEIIYQLSGDIELVTISNGQQSAVRLRPGEFVIVPKGVWHIGNAIERSSALFITWGDGSKHMPRETPPQ